MMLIQHVLIDLKLTVKLLLCIPYCSDGWLPSFISSRFLFSRPLLFPSLPSSRLLTSPQLPFFLVSHYHIILNPIYSTSPPPPYFESRLPINRWRVKRFRKITDCHFSIINTPDNGCTYGLLIILGSSRGWAWRGSLGSSDSGVFYRTVTRRTGIRSV